MEKVYLDKNERNLAKSPGNEECVSDLTKKEEKQYKEYVTTRDGVIVIAPVRRIRGKQSLKELVSRIPKNYKTREMDWGKPVGKEAW